MLRFPASRFSIPLWAPALLLLLALSFGITHRALRTHDPLQSVGGAHGRTLARSLSAAELLSRPLATNHSTIPKIYHQSWMSTELPAKFQKWSHSCRSLHPDWEWVLWTDEDNENLVRKYFPWLLESFRALPAEIYRADFSRSLYMYAFGGKLHFTNLKTSHVPRLALYNDLDTECLQPSETTLNNYASPRNIRTSSQESQLAFFGRMGNNPSFEHSIPNAWMAATPGHPFFLVHIEAVDRRVKGGNTAGILPESLTGPVSLREAIAAYELGKVKHGNSIGPSINEVKQYGPFANTDYGDHQVVLLPSEIIYPYSWGADGEQVRDVCWVLKDGFDPEECKKRLEVQKKGSISITYWSHTHSPDGQNTENMQHIN